MSKKRNKQHQPGERISVYLNKDLPPHFFEWLSKQDDVSAFVLYAMERLYAETGNINVSNYLPRRFFFEDAAVTRQDELPPRQVFIPSPSPAVVHRETTPVPAESSPSLTDHIQFEETEIPQGNNPAVPVQSIDNGDRDEGQQKLHVHYETSAPEVKEEENPLVETEPDSSNNTPWANLENVNADDF